MFAILIYRRDIAAFTPQKKSDQVSWKKKQRSITGLLDGEMDIDIGYYLIRASCCWSADTQLIISHGATVVKLYKYA